MFGEFVKAERLRQGLSIYALSKLTRITRKALGEIERGADPKLSNMRRICAALGVEYVVKKRSERRRCNKPHTHKES